MLTQSTTSWTKYRCSQNVHRAFCSHQTQSNRCFKLSEKGGIPDLGIDKQSSSCATRGCSHHSFRNKVIHRRIVSHSQNSFTSTKYPNLIKQSNGQKMPKYRKYSEIHSSIHTHIKGDCSHIHPQHLHISNKVKGYPGKISLKNSNIHKIDKTCKIQCFQCPLSLLVSQ